MRAYRAAFRPSERFERPHVIIGVSVICAPTDAEAEYQATSTDLAWVACWREFLPIPSPEEASAYQFSPQGASWWR